MEREKCKLGAHRGTRVKGGGTRRGELVRACLLVFAHERRDRAAIVVILSCAGGSKEREKCNGRWRGTANGGRGRWGQCVVVVEEEERGEREASEQHTHTEAQVADKRERVTETETCRDRDRQTKREQQGVTWRGQQQQRRARQESAGKRR